MKEIPCIMEQKVNEGRHVFWQCNRCLLVCSL